MLRAFFLSVVVSLSLSGVGAGQTSLSLPVVTTGQTATLADAQSLFYNGRYAEAVALTHTLGETNADELAIYELRTSALHFQIKRALGDQTDRDKALKECAICPAMLLTFQADFAKGRALARAAVEANPDDDAARFLLGKLDLNYVWLQLGTLGRKTGWNEYWEGRRSLDAVLKRNPQHVRARVARAWIDYIVETKTPWGTRWILGGGSKKRALAAMRDVATAETDRFARAEAGFALWEMQVRERDFAAATATARILARDFPDNHDVARFLEQRD